MLPQKEIWSMPSGTGVANAGGRPSMTGGSAGYAFMAAGMHLPSGSHGSGAMLGGGTSHDRSQEVCKYFINGGCLRGAACPYLHELPDERHLDVNGLGFILNANVHNAQKTVSTPQSVVGAGPNPGQVSPTSTGSPLVMGLGNQPGGNRQHQFGQGSNSGNGGKAGGKPHFSPMAAQSSGIASSVVKQPPKYRPPEPYLEHNLPPALALPLKAAPKDVAHSLAAGLLEG